MKVISAKDLELDEPQFKHCTGTRNACKLCTPLGACLAFRGVEGTIPFLHGSQGCSTYIRRYLISHFREPIDIASSNFSEDSAVFGGASNFKIGVANVVRQYQPKMVAVATTCLSETIGEDMTRLFHDYMKEEWFEGHPYMVKVSTPSYSGTHIDGFHAAVRALVATLAVPGDRTRRINLFSGMVSASDLRYLKEILEDHKIPYTLLPDYSESMDGETWSEYEKLQEGGTPIADIMASGCAQSSIEFGRTLSEYPSAGKFLSERFNVPNRQLGLPIGIHETDAFFEALAEITGEPMPVKHSRERGRLVDSLIDGHKYVFEKRAIVYGEEDLVVGIASFLSEIGVVPVLCASGGKSGRLKRSLHDAIPTLDERTHIHDGIDFAQIGEMADTLKADFIIGSSKGYQLSRKLDVPLIRIGFPIHDRIGGHRILHLGYRGAQSLYDTIVNALMDVKQTNSPIGYSYL
ncbi:MAG: nitrogenase component 1 [Chthoniobacteraceae bacterium]